MRTSTAKTVERLLDKALAALEEAECILRSVPFDDGERALGRVSAAADVVAGTVIDARPVTGKRAGRVK